MDAAERRPLGRGGWTSVVLALAGAVGLLLLVMQVVGAQDALDPAAFLNARGADRTVIVYAALAGLTLLLAAALPRRWSSLALLPGVALATVLLASAAILGGHVWDMAVAVLTAACLWQLGRWIVLAVGSPRLADNTLVAVVTGIGALGVLITLLGRVGLLRWWGIGLLTAAVGLVGLYGAGRAILDRRAAVVQAVTASRLAIVCAGLLALQLAPVAVWVSAPEIMFDPVYAKAWLPKIWAQTGSIEALIENPVLNLTGFAQLVAVPGHALGGPEVGRYMQLLAWVAAVAGVWAWGRRLGQFGPVAAVVVGVTPHLVWQSTNANDDLILALAALALALAVFGSVPLREGEGAARVGLVLGLLAGTCISLKLHLAPLALVLLAGWVLLGIGQRTFVRRLGGATVGALLTGAPPLIVRWIELGNPVFPSYNAVFRSPHFPPINTSLNFPFWPDAGLHGALTWMWEAVRQPALMNEATAPGAFGLLIGALFLAFVIGWRRSASPAAPIVWVALVVATVAWWVVFRYLRYLLPLFLVAVALVLVQAGGRPLHRRTGGALAVAAALLAAASLPVAIALFWNVPERKLPYAAVVGRGDPHEYVRHVYNSVDALEAYERAAPPGALALVSPEGAFRLYVDGRGLTPSWEVGFRFQADGSLPTTPDEGLRRLREKGIGWVLVAGSERALTGGAYLPGTLREHGEIVFADRGWDLYRLVDRPRNGDPLPSCDPRLVGRPNCWTGTLDPNPGLSAAEAPAGVSRAVAVCGGQTVAVRPAVDAAGAPAQVTIDFDGSDPLLGYQTGTVAQGTATPVFATAPVDARTATITVAAGAGGAIRSIGVAVKGGCAPAVAPAR